MSKKYKNRDANGLRSTLLAATVFTLVIGGFVGIPKLIDHLKNRPTLDKNQPAASAPTAQVK